MFGSIISLSISAKSHFIGFIYYNTGLMLYKPCLFFFFCRYFVMRIKHFQSLSSLKKNLYHSMRDMSHSLREQCFLGYIFIYFFSLNCIFIWILVFVCVFVYCIYFVVTLVDLIFIVVCKSVHHSLWRNYGVLVAAGWLRNLIHLFG